MEDLLLNRRGHACPNRNQGDASSEVEMRCAQAFKLFDTLEAQHAAWILFSVFPVRTTKGGFQLVKIWPPGGGMNLTNF